MQNWTIADRLVDLGSVTKCTRGFPPGGVELVGLGWPIGVSADD